MTSRLLPAAILLAASACAGGSSDPGTGPGTTPDHQGLSPAVTLYTDALGSGWADWSWDASVNLSNTRPVAGGTRSIAVGFSPWGGLYLHHAALSTATLENVELRIHGGRNGNAKLWAKAVVGGNLGAGVDLGKYCTGGSIPGNAWTSCKIPISALGAAGASLEGVVLQERTGRTLRTLYVDSMEISGSSAPSVPAAPSGLKVAVSGSSLSLGWNAVSGATGYNVLRSTSSGGTYTQLTASPVASASYVDSTVTTGTTYWYAVTAVSSAGESARSASVSGTVPAPASVSVAVSPKNPSVATGGTVQLTATVSGSSNGSVTWSVTEAAGGTVSASGLYTAPSSAGTFHVVATSVADATKSDTATMTVSAPTPPVVSVSISPSSAAVTTGGTVQFSATVSGTANGAVTWSVTEGASGGTVSSSGLYTAPAAAGTYHVVATSQADASKSASATTIASAPTPPGSIDPSGFLSADRATRWNPGLNAVGGIPSRNTVCRNVSPSGADDTAAIQAAINACPAGQVVQLAAGTFTVNSGNYIQLNKGVTLRGAGPTKTTLQKTNGAKPGSEATGANPSPIIIVGPARWSSNGTATSVTGSTNLTADAAKGANSITVSSSAGFKVGDFVLLDELSGASWQQDPAGRGQIWASSDFRVVWQRHNPAQGTDDPFPDAAGWFCRNDRPTAEVKQISAISGTTITFNTPVHISYRTSHTAQLSYYGYAFVQNAGVEDLKVIGGDQGNIRFQWAAQSWARNVENTVWHDEGFAVENSFRIEIREAYIHDAAWAQPGGAGYAISFSTGSSEILVENSISMKANKVMVARSSGAGSVFGYNYVDDGYINTNTSWIEVGLNASHMVGPHHVLFEGNYGFNWDSDKTHGNAIYHTVFRNYLPGVRRSYGDTTASGHGPLRCAGAAYYSYWHSFVGNVLGVKGQMSGWRYESGNMGNPAIWLLGWDDWSPYPVDAKVASTALRHGNLDYVTNSVTWDPNIADHDLPPSLYLTSKPSFFDAGKGYAWPWVDPTAATPVQTLPAKARFDAGTPFTQP